jgi:hypothetical protein
MGGHNIQPKSGPIVRIYLREMARGAMSIGEDAMKSFWPSDLGQKIKKAKFVVALGGRQLTNSHNNQPNPRGIYGRRIGEDVRLSGNAGGWYSIAPGAVEVGGGGGIK